MKKIVSVIIACIFFTALSVAGNCQNESGSDSGMDSSIEQSESAIGQSLDSEIGSDRAQSESEVSQVEESMATGQNY